MSQVQVRWRLVVVLVGGNTRAPTASFGDRSEARPDIDKVSLERDVPDGAGDRSMANDSAGLSLPRRFS
jgi:hypothetical protein